MTDEELIARLRKRAAEERDIQSNNEAVAAALMVQRLLFDQGIRSKANRFAVRLQLEHENYAKNNAKLARDWDTAADRLAAQAAEIERLRSALKKTEAQPLVLESVARGPREGESMTSWIRYHMKEARAALAALTGDQP